jgi:NAD(P)-dependent dehydrogenase (short-subunit alcohol dehydrogenase family)
MASNVEGPLFLTQQLLPKLVEDSRVIQISSDAAHQGKQA